MSRSQSRGIIDSISCNGDDVILRLQAIHDPQLVFWCHTGENADSRYDLVELVIGEAVQVFAFHSAGAWMVETEVSSDRGRRVDVVTGEHDHADAGRVGILNGFQHLGPHGILHALQPQKRKSVPQGVIVQSVVCVWAERRSEDTQSFTGQLRRCALNGISIENLVAPGAVVGVLSIANAEHEFRRSFQVDKGTVWSIVKGCHKPLLGFKGHDVQLGVIVPELLYRQAAFGRRGEKRELRRITDRVGSAQKLRIGLIREKTRQQRKVERSLMDAANRGLARPYFTVSIVPGSSNGVAAARRPDRCHRHLVLRESAGLIGADDGRAAESLDGR
jgi:hypothetical protein